MIILVGYIMGTSPVAYCGKGSILPETYGESTCMHILFQPTCIWLVILVSASLPRQNPLSSLSFFSLSSRSTRPLIFL